MRDYSGDGEKMKVKKIDKADGVKQKVYSRDKAMHIGMSDMWFSKNSRLEGEQEWQQKKYEYSEEVGEKYGYAGKRAAW